MKLINFENLKSKRLILRNISAEDVSLIYALRSSSIVRKYIMQPLFTTQEEAINHVIKLINYLKEDKSISWTIINKNTNEKLGTICLWNFSEDRKTAEVGYDLLPEYFKKGYMSEALKIIITFGFNELKLNSIEAYTHRENENSIKLLLANNFILNTDKKDFHFPKNSIYTLNRIQTF